MIQFGDSANPDNIPYQYAALYAADCDYPCPPGKDQRWDKEHKRWITFNGTKEASIIDFEKGTADFGSPAIIGRWLAERRDAGLTRHAWIYSDLSNAAQASRAANGIPFWWWVATLDDVIRSANELSALLQHWGVHPALAAPDRIDAQQWSNNRNLYDRSICYSGWI